MSTKITRVEKDQELCCQYFWCVGACELLEGLSLCQLLAGVGWQAT